MARSAVQGRMALAVRLERFVMRDAMDVAVTNKGVKGEP